MFPLYDRVLNINIGAALAVRRLLADVADTEEVVPLWQERIGAPTFGSILLKSLS